MQKKDLKIGGTYALTTPAVARRRTYRYDPEAVKATVVAFDGKYESARRYSRHKDTMNDGIVVRFDKPVKSSLFGLKHEKGGKTKMVVSDPRAFLSTWDEFEAEQKGLREAQDRWAREADESAAAFVPVLEATMKALREHGFKQVKLYGDQSGISFDGGSVPLRKSKGKDGKQKITGFDYRDARVPASDLLRLLGVEYGDPDDEGSDDE
jgi:hypothetical protein